MLLFSIVDEDDSCPGVVLDEDDDEEEDDDDDDVDEDEDEDFLARFT